MVSGAGPLTLESRTEARIPRPPHQRVSSRLTRINGKVAISTFPNQPGAWRHWRVKTFSAAGASGDLHSHSGYHVQQQKEKRRRLDHLLSEEFVQEKYERPEQSEQS
jgi:hypothetical protein